MSRAISEYVIGFVFSYTWNVSVSNLNRSYKTRNFILLNFTIWSNKEHLWMIKYWCEVEAFNILQNSFNANLPRQYIDIIDIILEGNIVS